MIAYFCELFRIPDNPLSIGGVYTIAKDWPLPDKFHMNGEVGDFEMHLDRIISNVLFSAEYRILRDADRILNYWTELYLSQSPDFDPIAWEAAKRLNASLVSTYLGGVYESK